MRRQSLPATVLVCLLMLTSACGQKGALFLPQEPAEESGQVQAQETRE